MAPPKAAPPFFRRHFAYLHQIQVLPNEALILAVLDAQIPLRRLLFAGENDLDRLAVVEGILTHHVVVPFVAAVRRHMNGVNIKLRLIDDREVLVSRLKDGGG